MTALIKKLYASDVVRYVFFGGCTTLVNLVSFFLGEVFTSLVNKLVLRSRTTSFSLITQQ